MYQYQSEQRPHKSGPGSSTQPRMETPALISDLSIKKSRHHMDSREETSRNYQTAFHDGRVQARVLTLG
jgi:hypothetical protein